ncbi:MAG: protein translocase subunit SecD [Gemmataceae bacterium]|nr:protein translocase subunit SecD [Gemmataceae bacterium]
MNYEVWQSLLIVAAVVAVTYGLYWACSRFMRPFHYRAFLCLLAVLVSGWVVAGAGRKYTRGEGGFKLGVDLIGGTILVYEVDVEKLKDTAGEDALAKLEPAKMVEFLKRRIDPNDLYNVTIRPVGGNTRYEIILPTGGSHQAVIKQQAWDALLEAVRSNPEWKAPLAGVDLNVDRDRSRDLGFRIRTALDKKVWTDVLAKFQTQFADKVKDVKLDGLAVGNIDGVAEAVKATGLTADEVKKFFVGAYKPIAEKDVNDFIAANYSFSSTGNRKDFSAELVEETKSLIARQGSLEFRIAANGTDDRPGIDAARKFMEDPKNKAELDSRARRGFAPPPVAAQADDPNKYSYMWVELDKTERMSLGLSNAMSGVSDRWKKLAQARTDGKIVVDSFPHNDTKGGRSGEASFVFYSRPCLNEKLTEEERAKKQFEYFMLLRDPIRDSAGKPQAITGERLRRAEVNDFDQAVSFDFDSEGGRMFGNLTSSNVPTPPGQQVNLTFRHLAIVLDGMIVSAPFLSTRIDNSGQIQMSGSPREDRVRLAKILRSGALPAPIKPIPVSESTIGATLGGDTIFKGLLSVGIAFAAVLVFMVFYYQFAGCVACVALLANLLLTVAFMVFVNATFTLPGLAGLVLMLGMAVDANVLIYERIREERERGAGLTVALRNGYDRAFPTIIDTHLTSFFTAVVLYAVGNDQLRGFGISLAAGLVISLFTSLYMTRLLFDVWQYKGWLKNLSMRKFFTKTNIDFMSIRYYWFTATIILTVVGLSLFLLRGSQGLNVDFVGGTAYGGQLKEGQARTIGELRELLSAQGDRLAVAQATQIDDAGKVFRITYKNFPDPQPQVEFVEPVDGTAATKEAREKTVAERAKLLPDWSVEQTFVAGDTGNKAGASRFFTVRTTEKDADLVQVNVDRLLSEVKDGKLSSLLKSITLDKYDVKGKQVSLEFSDYASPGYLKLFLAREFTLGGFGPQSFDLRGEGKGQESRYKNMTLEITTSAFDPAKEADRAKLDAILKQTKADFASRPQPERLEKFDAQLAAETSARAAYAILLSWAVILGFLWFRFGNWTFGLAAVMCLIHDLAFTLGAIAGAHYLVKFMPGVASMLLIDDFKIDLPAIAAMLTLIGYSVNDTIVVFDRIREVRGKNPQLTPQMINDSVNQTLSRTLLAATTVFLVVGVLYVFGGESIRLFSFVMVLGVIVGTYSSIYIAAPLLLIFGEGKEPKPVGGRALAESAKS